MSSEGEQLAQIRDHAAALAQAYTTIRDRSHALRQSAGARKESADGASAKAHAQRLQHAEGLFLAQSSEVHTQLAQIESAGGLNAASWTDPRWPAYDPRNQDIVPTITRLGVLSEAGCTPLLELPALVPLIGSGNLLIEATGAGKDVAVRALQSVMLRLLGTMPPGKLRFLLIDPVGLGQSVAGFMQLDKYGEELITSRAWTEPNHIEQRLADMSAHMETVIQKYLRNQYADMEAYNREAGEVAEPYRVVVVANFPAAFSEAAARRLVSIASNGARCGVHVLATVDTLQPMPYGFNASDLQRVSHVVSWADNRFIWRDPVFSSCTLVLDDPPEKDLFDSILHKAGDAAQKAAKVEVPLTKVLDVGGPWWSECSQNHLAAPIGRAGARKVQLLALGEGTAQHALVGGRTGSGKSTLMHVIIASLAVRYSPSELQLYLIDFKKGVEFKEYATADLPHARVVAVESEREFGLSVLQGLDAELERRGELFRAAGVNSISDYRKETGTVLPRLLLLVDEFQEFFSEEDNLAARASLLLDRLVRQGRAFGMHVVLGSQTLAGSYSLARSTIDQMAVRVALQCTDADSRLILSDDNGAARLLGRPGEAIYNAENGLFEGNQLFQTAWITAEQRSELLAEAHHRAERVGISRTAPLIVFEGNEPADISRNTGLEQLIKGTPPAPLGRTSPAFVGEPIAIKESTAAVFRRQGSSHLLIVGQNEKAAVGVLASAAVSLAAWHRSASPARFVHLDFTTAEAPWSDFASRIVTLTPSRAKATRRREVAVYVDGVYQELQARLGDPETGSRDEIYLFVWGLQRARDLRDEEEGGYSRWGEDEASVLSTAQQFGRIIRDGPDLGIHVLAWCDSYSNLTRSLQRKEIGEFGMRIVFQMNAEDSSYLIDSPAAGKLGPNRAHFLDEYTGATEKFRPYDIPDDEWLRQIAWRWQAAGG